MSIFTSTDKGSYSLIAQGICDAGGSIVGRTRLQKTFYILKLAGFEIPFHFEYKHYGPFSEQLAEEATIGAAFGKLSEDQKVTNWGGSYFVYTATGSESEEKERVKLARAASSADAVALELAATAAYLFLNGYEHDAWEETARRKPDKIAGGKLELAKKIYGEFRNIKTPKDLPLIPG